jgi:hypothetical protein
MNKWNWKIFICFFSILSFSSSKHIKLTYFNIILNDVISRDSVTDAILCIKDKDEVNDTFCDISILRYSKDTIKIECKKYTIVPGSWGYNIKEKTFYVINTKDVNIEFNKFQSYRHRVDLLEIVDSLKRISDISLLSNHILSAGMPIDTVLQLLNCEQIFMNSSKVAYVYSIEKGEFIEIECHGYIVNLQKKNCIAC